MAFLDAVQVADGPKWLRQTRDKAAARVRAEGLPTKKIEAWRFTPISPITDHRFSPVASNIAVQEPSPAGVEVRSLAAVLRDEPELVAAHLGRHADNAHFSGLNTALFSDGLFVRVPAGVTVEHALDLTHLAQGAAEARVSYPRLLFLVEESAHLRLVERCLGSESALHLTNLVAEIVIADNATVEHVRIHNDPGLHVARVDVHQARKSRYHSHVVTLGGKLLRLDIRAVLDGEGAECILNGAYHVTGSDHIDHHTLVEHAKPHCFSRQTYRGVLDDKGHAVFDGIVKVHRDAQKTEAHQENRNLLLSDSATVHTKPHLEIDADDVICSHGATVGALDADQLFYLRTRGIAEEPARAILTFAFLRALIDQITEPGVRESLTTELLQRLPQGDLLEGLS